MKKLLFILPIFLTGCNLVDTLTGEADKQEQVKTAKAVGAGCRQSGRNIEDCYSINPKSLKSAVFDGWKEMDQYMRENKLEIQQSKVEPQKEEEKKVNKKTEEPAPVEEKPSKH